MKSQIDLPHEWLEAFCRRWKIAELALFGSILREDFQATKVRGSEFGVRGSFGSVLCEEISTPTD